MTDKKVTLSFDPDVVAWLNDVLFPDPESGRQGAVSVNGVPGTPEFDQAVDLFTRAREQLAP